MILICEPKWENHGLWPSLNADTYNCKFLVASESCAYRITMKDLRAFAKYEAFKPG
jgi:hypothetical protein